MPKVEIMTGEIVTDEQPQQVMLDGFVLEGEVLSPGEVDEADLEEMWFRFHKHDAAFVLLGRKTLEQAWYAGDILCRIKKILPHGQWLDALDERGVANQTANRYMRLRQGFAEIPQNGEFDTMQQALEYLRLQQEDLWSTKEGDVETDGTETNSSGSDDDLEDEDTGFEIMQDAVNVVRKGLGTCSNEDQEGGLAAILVGWLMDIPSMRQAMLNMADEWVQHNE